MRGRMTTQIVCGSRQRRRRYGGRGGGRGLESEAPDYRQGESGQGRIGWRTHAAVEPTI